MNHFWNSVLHSLCLLFTGEAILLFLFLSDAPQPLSIFHVFLKESLLMPKLSNLPHSHGCIAKSSPRQHITYFVFGPCKMSGWQFCDFIEKPQELLWNSVGSVDPPHLARDPNLHPGFVVLCVLKEAECGSKEQWSTYICLLQVKRTCYMCWVTRIAQVLERGDFSSFSWSVSVGSLEEHEMLLLEEVIWCFEWTYLLTSVAQI